MGLPFGGVLIKEKEFMLSELITELRSTTKPKEKLAILASYDSPFFRRILKATFDPFIKHHVKVQNKHIPTPGVRSIDEEDMQADFLALLNYCVGSKSNKQNRIAAVELLSQLDVKSQELIVGTLNKNWKCGASGTTVNKAYPKLIRTYEVQLANKFEDAIVKKKYIKKTRWASYKLDGVRCTFIRFEDHWEAISRQGKEFFTVDHIKPELEVLYKRTGKTFWDGELYVPGLIFEDIQSLVMSFTTGTSYELEFRAFICGYKEDFFAQLFSRMEIVTKEHTEGVENVNTQEQWLLHDDNVMEALEEAFELGHEGLMLRDPDQLYDFKRSDALLKIKESDSDKSEEVTADCLVIGYTTKSIPIVENGMIVFKELINRLIVLQEDEKECKVGSGFELDFRKAMTEDPSIIMEKVVEIKFQGYGNKGRMRFPRLFRVREDLTWGD